MVTPHFVSGAAEAPSSCPRHVCTRRGHQRQRKVDKRGFFVRLVIAECLRTWVIKLCLCDCSCLVNHTWHPAHTTTQLEVCRRHPLCVRLYADKQSDFSLACSIDTGQGKRCANRKERERDRRHTQGTTGSRRGNKFLPTTTGTENFHFQAPTHMFECNALEHSKNGRMVQTTAYQRVARARDDAKHEPYQHKYVGYGSN
jgi:hypothetical protein